MLAKSERSAEVGSCFSIEPQNWHTLLAEQNVNVATPIFPSPGPNEIPEEQLLRAFAGSKAWW